MRIKAKKIPKPEPISSEDLLSRFCYHFPQYTYAQARKLPYKRVVKMLKIYRKEEARLMYQLAQILAASHSKDGFKSISSYYKEIINE